MFGSSPPKLERFNGPIKETPCKMAGCIWSTLVLAAATSGQVLWLGCEKRLQLILIFSNQTVTAPLLISLTPAPSCWCPSRMDPVTGCITRPLALGYLRVPPEVAITSGTGVPGRVSLRMLAVLRDPQRHFLAWKRDTMNG